MAFGNLLIGPYLFGTNCLLPFLLPGTRAPHEYLLDILLTYSVIRVATVADSRFTLQAANLARSVQSSTTDHSLTIFCDDEQRFSHLRSTRCDVVELPEIKRLGAKRAKFTAFTQALRKGDMIYLDADAIVLESLEGMGGGSVMRGCADGLEYCNFIPDKIHPWPSHATLTNKIYINSGGFFAPSSQLTFFEYLQCESLDETKWKRYTIEDCFWQLHLAHFGGLIWPTLSN